jgi:two-component system cell cycle sensor histidine kinase/response regulator CckA
VSEKRAAAQALQTLEDRYRQAQKMEAVGRLAGGIAHDFNNVLTVIQGNCDLLADSIDPATEQGQDLAQIRAAAERAGALTRQLLAFSRRQVLAPKKFRLDQTVAALEPMLRRLIGVDVPVEVAASSSGLVLADPGQMEQVILNLALNARDAMPDGGRLRIEIDDVELGETHAASLELEPGSYVRLQVIDTGVGMSSATLAQVFEPFFTTKPEGQGTGLGLATVHGIVKQSRGGIEVHSTVGVGTTFARYLPLIRNR